MGMVVRSNIMAMNAFRQLGMNNSAVGKSLEKLSSGFRINRAADDAAGLAISEKMKAQIKGLETASANAQDGISLIQTAEGNLNEVHDMLNRMVELATKSANGTYTQTERDAMQDEVDQLLDEIDRISQSANFNGAKLLDGSLAAKGGATKVEIGGNVTTKKSTAEAATYHTTNPLSDLSSAKEGGTFTYTVALSDGTSHSLNFTFGDKNADGFATSIIAEDGTKYAIADAAGTVTAAELSTAIATELNKGDLGKLFNVTANKNFAPDSETEAAEDGKFIFKALEAGTETPTIVAVDIRANPKNDNYSDSNVDVNGTAGTGKYANTNIAVVTPARDEGREIDANSITEYDGTNYEDAVFTINGHKFVVLTNDIDTTKDPDGNDSNSYLHAVAGLGSDVTILVGGKGGLMSGGKAGGVTTKPVPGGDPDVANNNFEQNIKKIAEVTGLKVTDAIGVDATTPVDGNDIYAGSGIRLSLGDGATGGLVLQIGDTADEFNKLRVSIEDMSAKGLKIKDLSVKSEPEASNAISRIKAAINTVSSQRASLGAFQNRLEHTINNLDVAAENMSAANSRIRDTDMAKEMMNYTKMNVLVQSAQAMLAQANQQPQSVLQLLQ